MDKQMNFDGDIICLTCHLDCSVPGYALCSSCLAQTTQSSKAMSAKAAIEEASKIIAEGQIA